MLFVKIFFLSIIGAYRWFVAPFIKTQCCFYPTCSQYAIIAITSHGVVRGLYLTLRRLLRCHPFKIFGNEVGFDPVPTPKGDR